MHRAIAIKDPHKVQPSVSHYRFKRSMRGFVGWSHRFQMTTIDGVTYIFNASTGKIVNTTP